jgi:hypothetical protein
MQCLQACSPVSLECRGDKAGLRSPPATQPGLPAQDAARITSDATCDVTYPWPDDIPASRSSRLQPWIAAALSVITLVEFMHVLEAYAGTGRHQHTLRGWPPSAFSRLPKNIGEIFAVVGTQTSPMRAVTTVEQSWCHNRAGPGCVVFE